MKTEFVLEGYGSDERLYFETVVPRHIAKALIPDGPGGWPVSVTIARIMAPECPDNLEYFVEEMQMSVERESTDPAEKD